MSPVDFASSKNELLLNPGFSQEHKKFFEAAWASVLNEMEAHVGIVTSGTSGEFGKLVLLKKSAFLNSATSVNQHLQIQKEDIWLKALPNFHVGGLSILARASLTNSKVIELQDTKWKADKFFDQLRDSKASIISLVPTQIFDLIKLQLKAPETLRAVLIGGAALAPDLYFQAKELGWNLLPSYGMTETCSMIACAELNEASATMPLPKVLSHAKLRLEGELLEISANSLLTAYVLKTEEGIKKIDPKRGSWFLTEDRAVLHADRIQILGRGSDFYKIGAESISLLRLENILSQVRLETVGDLDFTLLAVPEERLGHQIELLCTAKSEAEVSQLVTRFNKRVAAFEKIRRIHYTSQIPRTALGKLKKQEALKLIYPES